MTHLTRQLRDDPEPLFAQLILRPLRILVRGQDLGRFDGDRAVAHSYRVRGHRTASLRALDRVAWARIEEENGCHNITISRTYGELEDAEPCYYLPWIPDHTLGMKLKPSQKLTDQARFDAYVADDATRARAAAQRQMLQQIENAEHRAPRLFFTAMLTGCSVHIDGDRTQPNVYHGNAVRKQQASFSKKSFGAMTTRKEFQARMVDTDSSLRRGYRRMPWEHGEESSCVSVLDYDYRFWGNETLAAKWGNGADLLTPELREAGAQVKSMFAVVFGVRDLENDEWTFYGQRVYSYQRPWVEGMAAGAHRGHLGYEPRQIWPGHGHIQL